NPWTLERTPGGSSGGSAAAVAAGLVPVAHANDGGGSIRIPAAACGLVGLKPSRGRVSWGPVFWEPDAGLAVEGVVTRTVRDTAALLDVLAGTFPGDPYAAPSPVRPWAEELGGEVGRLRIGVLDDPPAGALPTDPACAEALNRVAAALEELGHAVEPSAPDALMAAGPTDRWVDWWAVTAVAAPLAAFENVLGSPIGPGDVEPLTWALAERGRATSATDFLRVRDELGTLVRAAATWWADGFDLLLTPTLQAPPPPLGELMSGDPQTVLRRQMRWCPLTPFANVSGQPAISVPVQPDGRGVPLGAQLMAELGREDLLIRVAAQLEEALPWRLPSPPVAVAETSSEGSSGANSAS
ncbi:MAG: amidase, partial [Actinomycetota bacterium]|nr:amidase [Actinomycetota bacterium]